MDKPKFNNRPNDHIMYGFQSEHTGVKIRQDYWISRAPAVVGMIFAFGVDGGARVLIIKRSKNMYSEPNKHAAPSGYLDWNENGFDGITREIYEETSMYLPDYKPFLIFNNNKQPFFINTEPNDDWNQNVSLMYVMAYDFTSHQEYFPKEIEKYTDKETAEVLWLPLNEFHDNKYTWAFNHDERIKMAIDFFNKNYKLKK